MAHETRLQGSSLIAELNDLLWEPASARAFALQRIKRDARKLVQEHPVESHQIRGMIATLEGDEQSMRDAFRIALRLAPGNGDVADNFVASLLNLGFSREAAENAAELYKQGKSKYRLRLLLLALCDSGQIDAAADALVEWDRLAPGEDFRGKGNIEAVVSFCRQECLDEKELQMVATAVDKVVKQAHRSQVSATYRVVSDEESARLIRLFTVASPPARIAKINTKIAEFLAKRRLTATMSRTINFLAAPAET